MSRLLGHAVLSNLISSCVRGATALGGYNFFTNISNPTKLRKKINKEKRKLEKKATKIYLLIYFIIKNGEHTSADNSIWP